MANGGQPTGVDPLTFLTQYQQAKWAPMGTGPTPSEILEFQQELAKQYAELGKAEAEIRAKGMTSYTEYQKALLQASYHGLAALANAVRGQAEGMKALATYSSTVLRPTVERLAASRFMEGNAEARQLVSEALGGGPELGFLNNDGLEGLMERAKASGSDLQSQFNQEIFPQGISQALREANVRLRTLQGEEKVNTARDIATMLGKSIGYAVGDSEEGLRLAEGALYGEGGIYDTLMQSNNISFDDMNLAMQRSDAARAELGELLAYEEVFLKLGLPAPLVKQHFDAVRKAMKWDDPQTFLQEFDEMDSPKAIQRALDALDEAKRNANWQDPYEAAKWKLINAIGDIRFFNWMAAMGFQGEHKVDKAAIYAAKHVPEVRSFLRQMQDRPELMDESIPWIERKRQIRKMLKDNGLHTTGLARGLGIRIPMRGNRAGVPGFKRVGAGKPGGLAAKVGDLFKSPDVRMMEKVAAQQEAERAAEAAKPPADDDVPPTEIKPTAGEEAPAQAAGTMDYQEGEWIYRKYPDGTIRIWGAPEGHQAGKLLVPGDAAYEAIQDHIDRGLAKPIGGPEAEAPAPTETLATQVLEPAVSEFEPEEAAFETEMAKMEAAPQTEMERQKTAVFEDLLRRFENAPPGPEKDQLMQAINTLMQADVRAVKRAEEKLEDVPALPETPGVQARDEAVSSGDQGMGQGPGTRPPIEGKAPPKPGRTTQPGVVAHRGYQPKPGQTAGEGTQPPGEPKRSTTVPPVGMMPRRRMTMEQLAETPAMQETTERLAGALATMTPLTEEQLAESKRLVAERKKKLQEERMKQRVLEGYQAMGSRGGHR